jgi:hypothetical protein
VEDATFPEFEDFSLLIANKRRGGYPVIATADSAGEGRGLMKLPFEPEEIVALRQKLDRYLLGNLPRVRKLAERVGTQLFNSLFAGRILRLFDRA